MGLQDILKIGPKAAARATPWNPALGGQPTPEQLAESYYKPSTGTSQTSAIPQSTAPKATPAPASSSLSSMMQGLTSTSGGGVGSGGAIGGGGADAIDVAPPQDPAMQIGAASEGSGNTTQLGGPGGLRQGLGSRIYPALHALLRSPVY